jgi:hypothetical protein
MTSKERALRNYSFQPVDRFTIDFCASSDVYAKMRAHYGVADDLELMEALHVDFRYPKPNWIGFPLVDREGRPTDYFGIPRRGVGDFGYPIVHPLAHVQSIGDLQEYAYWPTADMWDYDRYLEDCRRFDEYAVLGGAWAWFFEAGCELVGMDRFFYLMADHPEVAHAILEKTTGFEFRPSRGGQSSQYGLPTKASQNSNFSANCIILPAPAERILPKEATVEAFAPGFPN